MRFHFHSLKNFIIFLSLTLALAIPTAGFCGIWELTQAAISKYGTETSFEQVTSHLHYLTAAKNIVLDADRENTFIIAGGYIVISPDSIQSFKNPGDYANRVAPEFEILLTDVSGGAAAEARHREGLERIRIALDIIPSHRLFKTPIGDWTYEQFVIELQLALGTSLRSAGAEVFNLRPELRLTAETFDRINENPPQIVISTQFNDDKQDRMVTFCGGNILEEEFTSERQRARFIEAALTGKHLYSAGLGSSMTKHCQDKLGVQPLDWERSSFEGNASPVAASALLRSDADLEEDGGYLNGIAMRNLIHNGLFARAVVVPFPDMQWIQSQIRAGHESEWITLYAQTLTEAVLDYVGKHSEAF